MLYHIKHINGRMLATRLLRRISNVLLMVSFIIIGTNCAQAQLAGLQSVYFQNQYLANPAMAGLEKGLNLNMGYQQQWTGTPGGPKLQSFTADYNGGNNVGLGINANNDNSGLFSTTRVMGTYAYHLPINGAAKLNFGLSIGISDSYINYDKIVGNPDDISAMNFNQRNVYADGDFGISYTGSKLTVQGAVPNLKSVFFKNDNDNPGVDRSTFFTAVSYKIQLSNNTNGFTIEPKVALRGIKGFTNIFDAGANLTLANYNLNFTGIYHTDQSATLAAGFDLKTVGLLFAYTSNTGPLTTYANNTFEMGVTLRLFGMK